MTTGLDPTPQTEDDTIPTTTTLPKLPLHGTTQLVSPATATATCTAHPLACNPAIDLVATVADGGSAVHVSRAGGEGGVGLVWKYAERGVGRGNFGVGRTGGGAGLVVEGLRWRGDGELFPFFRSCGDAG